MTFSTDNFHQWLVNYTPKTNTAYKATTDYHSKFIDNYKGSLDPYIQMGLEENKKISTKKKVDKTTKTRIV